MNVLDTNTIFRQLWSLWGGADWASEPPDAIEFATMRTWLDQRLRQAWNYYAWPEVTLVEKRYFRPFWSTLEPLLDAADVPVLDENGDYILVAASYDQGDEVYYPPTGKYYIALANLLTTTPADANGDVQADWAECEEEYEADPWAASTDYALRDRVVRPEDDYSYECIAAHTSGATFDSTYWALLTPFRRYVKWEEIYEQPIGEVLGVFDKDPRAYRLAATVPFIRTQDGVEIHQELDFVWLRWRKRCPRLTGSVFSNAATYTVRQQVYYERTDDGRGDFYSCWLPTAAGQSPQTNPGNWSLIEIPARFEDFLTRACLASAHAADKEWQRAAQMEREALVYLDDEIAGLIGEDWSDRRVEVLSR